MTMQSLKLTYITEAEIYLSEDGTEVLTVLADGRAIRLARKRFDRLPHGLKPWGRHSFTALYWIVRLAVLLAAWLQSC